MTAGLLPYFQVRLFRKNFAFRHVQMTCRSSFETRWHLQYVLQNKLWKDAAASVAREKEFKVPIVKVIINASLSHFLLIKIYELFCLSVNLQRQQRPKQIKSANCATAWCLLSIQVCYKWAMNWGYSNRVWMFTCVNPKLGYLNNQVMSGISSVYHLEWDIVEIYPPCFSNAEVFGIFFEAAAGQGKCTGLSGLHKSIFLY